MYKEIAKRETSTITYLITSAVHDDVVHKHPLEARLRYDNHFAAHHLLTLARATKHTHTKYNKMDNNSIDNNDLFNLLDLDSIFEGGDADDLFSTDTTTREDEGYSLAGDLTTVGFGSNNNGGNTATFNGGNGNFSHRGGGNYNNNYGLGGGGGDNSLADSAAQLDDVAFASLSFPTESIGTATNTTATTNNPNNNNNNNTTNASALKS